MNAISLSECLRNTERLRECAVKAKASPFTDLNIIDERVGDARFTCLKGRYQDLVGFSVEPGHFGLTDDEFSRLFGPASSGTITERLWLIDAHIQHLQMLMEEQDQRLTA